MSTTNPATPAVAQTATAVTAAKQSITQQVLSRIEEATNGGSLTIAKDYKVGNHVNMAYMMLQDMTDREGKPITQVCKPISIVKSLYKMVLLGLDPTKKQCYFIPYKDDLQLSVSYQGNVAIAKRVGAIKGVPVANVIYEGDDFVYTIDPETGLTKVVKHDQKIENIDLTKIKAAYAITTLANGDKQVTLMTIAQIRAAWGQGATKGGSGAHRNFTDEMAKKTVLNRAIKLAIGASDDAWLADEDATTTKDSEPTKAATPELEEEVTIEATTVASLPPANATGTATNEPATLAAGTKDDDLGF